MNILFLLFTPRYSGAEIVIKNLIENDDKINSFVLCSPGYFPNGLKNCLKIYYSKYIRKLRRDKNSFVKNSILILCNVINLNFVVVNIIKRDKINRVHINNITLAAYLLPSAFIYMLIKSKTKFSWHDHNITYSYKYYEKYLYGLCYCIYRITIVVSDAVKGKYCNDKKINIVYSGIDVKKFSYNKNTKRTISKELKINNKIVIGYIGSLSKEKGVDFLINSFIDLRKKYNNIYLLLIGNFNDSDANNNEIKKLLFGLKNTEYNLLDWKEDIEKYYCIIDILVNTTTTKLGESLGSTILEAMSSNRLVLASNTGGTAEIVSDGINGFLYIPEDKNNFIVKMSYLVDNFEKLNKVRSNARKRIVNNFNIDKMVTKFNEAIGLE
jgi:glycosyltransferase involved in cell wall biosynthesis